MIATLGSLTVGGRSFGFRRAGDVTIWSGFKQAVTFIGTEEIKPSIVLDTCDCLIDFNLQAADGIGDFHLVFLCHSQTFICKEPAQT